MTTAPPTLSDDDLHQMAERFVDTLLDSASVDVIGATHWWERARTALLAAASSATSWPQCVAVACRKLQIDTLTAGSSTVIADLGAALTPPDLYSRWARLAARDAVYTVAMVRVTRDARRAERKARKTPTPQPATPVDHSILPGF